MTNKQLSEKDSIQKIEQSPPYTHLLAYHIMPEKNWMNDPNGLIYWKGEYHVFFQHDPYYVTPHLMHWGHVKSKDLVQWEYQPVALTPTKEYEKSGCWSGSAVDDNGMLTLIYTGHKMIDQEKDILEQVQCIATSSDGIHFIKHPNPVIAEPPKEGSYHFRDPKVWKHEDHWYMVVGTTKEQTGKVVLYKSKDLRDWEYVGVMAESDGTIGYMWECPDLFKLGDKHVLVISPQGIEADGMRYQNHHQSVYLVGDLDYKTGKFAYNGFEEIDYGFDFYAPQTFEDGNGRRILIGWMDMWEADMPTQKDGWSGAMTVPRELNFSSDHKILMTPVEELQLLRGEKWEECNLNVSRKEILPIKGNSLEVIAEFKVKDAESFGTMVHCADDESEKTVIKVDLKEEYLIFDRSNSGEGKGDGIRCTRLQRNEDGTIKLHLFIDRSSLEVFANDGEAVMSGRVYPKPSSTGISLFTENGEVNVQTLKVWKLKDIWSE